MHLGGCSEMRGMRRAQGSGRGCVPAAIRRRRRPPPPWRRRLCWSRRAGEAEYCIVRAGGASGARRWLLAAVPPHTRVSRALPWPCRALVGSGRRATLGRGRGWDAELVALRVHHLPIQPIPIYLVPDAWNPLQTHLEGDPAWPARL